MVFYYESTVVQPTACIYVGEDKHENEELIRWGWPEDVWFHVDKVRSACSLQKKFPIMQLSSAHVYLRLTKGQTLDDVPSQLIDDCAQLVKANSIQGNKMNNIDVVYTMWSNLNKTADMAVGQASRLNSALCDLRLAGWIQEAEGSAQGARRETNQ